MKIWESYEGSKKTERVKVKENKTRKQGPGLGGKRGEKGKNKGSSESYREEKEEEEDEEKEEEEGGTTKR